jgi:hypothetical protein
MFQKLLRPNFVTFLKKQFEITGGEFRIVNRYEVGENLGLDSPATDNIVKQLSQMHMIKIMEGPKIILTQQALSAIDRSESSS